MLCSRWLARYDAASLLVAATILAPGGTARRNEHAHTRLHLIPSDDAFTESCRNEWAQPLGAAALALSRAVTLLGSKPTVI